MQIEAVSGKSQAEMNESSVESTGISSTCVIFQSQADSCPVTETVLFDFSLQACIIMPGEIGALHRVVARFHGRVRLLLQITVCAMTSCEETEGI